MIDDRGLTVSHPHLLVLRCPRTALPLRPASAVEATAAGLADVVASADGRFVYPVDGRIYVLLESAAVPMNGAAPGRALTGPKAIVQQFYNEFGWKPSGSDHASFVDGAVFEDTREVSADYRQACNERVVAQLRPSGRYLLDAASGPIQYQDYLRFSANYDVRVCVDLSIAALRVAADTLGDRGVCVVGDVTNLPIQDASMDGVVSLHTIYHVPSDEQAQAFRELHRVLAPGCRAVVVYSWGNSVSMRLLHLPLRAKHALGKVTGRPARRAKPTVPALYFSPHSRRWFLRQPWPFEFEVASWRSISVPALRAYVPASRAGHWALKELLRLEERLPRLFGRIGQYPLITIKKDPVSVAAVDRILRTQK